MNRVRKNGGTVHEREMWCSQNLKVGKKILLVLDVIDKALECVHMYSKIKDRMYVYHVRDVM